MTTNKSWDELNRDFAVEVVSRLRAQQFIAYFAGGCVRDQLLGVTPKDYDVATSASPEQIIQIFGRRNTLMVGAAFGVACVHRKLDGHAFQVEVATFRTDGEYLDGRRPSSVRFATPEADAQRRDFTINGMFYDPLEDRLHDFVGGQSDLKTRIVRSIGDAACRIAEDKLRMVRAVRFAARLNFLLDSATESAIVHASTQLSQVSQERLADELSKIAMLPQAAWAMDRLHDYGLLATIWPGLAQVWSADDALKQRCLALLKQSDTRHLSALAALLLHRTTAEQPDLCAEILVDEFASHLKLSNQTREEVSYFLHHIDTVLAAGKLPWSVLQPIAAHRCSGDLISLAKTVAMVTGRSMSDIQTLEQKLAGFTPEELNPAPLLNGSDLMKLGYRPGPDFRIMLQEVRNQQLDGLLLDQQAAIHHVQTKYARSSDDVLRDPT